MLAFRFHLQLLRMMALIIAKLMMFILHILHLDKLQVVLTIISIQEINYSMVIKVFTTQLKKHINPLKYLVHIKFALIVLVTAYLAHLILNSHSETTTLYPHHYHHFYPSHHSVTTTLILIIKIYTDMDTTLMDTTLMDIQQNRLLNKPHYIHQKKNSLKNRIETDSNQLSIHLIL